jgi:ferredoxin-NADP reductase/MOSC domain-containing protein YiiM/ferredoxin
MGTLISVNVGLPQAVPWKGKQVLTGIWKRPVEGRIRATPYGLNGDGQADLLGHGGEERAVLVYQIESYEHWNQYLGRTGYELGQFGENLTVDGLADDEVCIGDRYQIGEALFEVSQPRVTCFKLGLRMGHEALPGLLVSSGRPGFYMRVIHEGTIAAGDEIVKVRSAGEQMSVAEIDALLYKAEHPTHKLQRALRISALSPGWKGSFSELLKAAVEGKAEGNVGLMPAGETAMAWKGFRPLLIAEIRQESDDVKSFMLAATDDSPLPEARAGQHIAIKIERGAAGSAATRFYSLSGNPQNRRYRISVKREAPGSASDCLHAWAKVGATLEASAPIGQFVLEPGTCPVVLLSGGVGVTPMMSMLHEMADSEAGCLRDVWWVHGAKNGDHHSFRGEVKDALKHFRMHHSYIAYSQPSASDKVGEGFDAAGRVTLANLQALELPRNADFYLCGPGGFLENFTADLHAWGVDDSRIHSEVFGAPKGPDGRIVGALRPPHTPSGPAGTGLSVTFMRSGISVGWDPRYQSLLGLAEACDVPTRWSCRAGVCHTCQSTLIDGSVKYMPVPLSEPSAGTVLICCAVPNGEIHLDL